MLHIKFGFDWPSGFREEDLWKWWTTDGRRTDHGHPISSPCEPNGSGELKIHISNDTKYFGSCSCCKNSVLLNEVISEIDLFLISLGAPGILQNAHKKGVGLVNRP